MFTTSFAATELSLRPAVPNDQPFLATLYQSARPDLHLIQGDEDKINTVRQQQHEALQYGVETQYPNALQFVIEKTQCPVGGLIVDFGHNEVRIIFLAFIPTARGQGHGKTILRGLQNAATQSRSPIAVIVWHNNPGAKKVYTELGFQTEETHPLSERMVWYPGRSL